MPPVPEVPGDRSASRPGSAGSRTVGDRLVLVTGARGFVGRHVVRALADRGARVTGTSRHGPDSGHGTAVPTVRGDLADPDFVRALVDDVRPDIVIHLAAATRPDGTDDGFGGFGDTLRSTSHLVSALSARSPGSRLIVLSSSAVYGRPVSLPVDERAAVRPVNPYGVSKAAQELVALRARWAGELEVGVLRAFNLVGPGLPRHLLLGDVARQLAQVTAGHGAVVEVGNLEPRRDYVDVRDAVDALIAVAGSAEPPTLANIASGRSWSVSEVVHRLVDLSGRRVEVRQAPGRQRAVDIPEQTGDAGLLRAATGWAPRFDLDRSLRDMLEASSEPQHGESPWN